MNASQTRLFVYKIITIIKFLDSKNMAINTLPIVRRSQSWQASSTLLVVIAISEGEFCFTIIVIMISITGGDNILLYVNIMWTSATLHINQISITLYLQAVT